MKLDNYVKWLHLVTTRPNIFAIILRRFFDGNVCNCTCRNDGNLYVRGNINRCVRCTDSICTLDTHYFLGKASTAIIGWLALIFEGNIFPNRLIMTHRLN